ncbi:MAG: SHOCT domain-containing protein [Thermoleophilia bacterium]|jgi:membrane protease subunit (stomatin/prohibitin family)|nr:SHOCT domain-containing protein [Thermoleophilia bacterium]
MRAAVVGGTAAYAGNRMAKSSQREADQNAQIAELQQQQDAQQQQQYAPPAAAAPAQEDSIERLKQLKALLDQGVLTQAEFDLEKQKILQNM